MENPFGNVDLERALAEGCFVVIPAYNEGEAIEEVVREVLRLCPRVAVIDDGSSDETAEAAWRAGACVLRHVLNRGQGAALQTGIRFALERGARFVVTFDADGQHRVEDVPALLEPLVSGRAEIALGSRFLGAAENIPRGRRILLKAGVVFTRVVNGVRLTDTHNGLRAFSRRAAEAIDIKLDRMAHASEMIDLVRRSRLPFVEVPVRIRYTRRSLAKGQRSGNAFRIVVDYLLGRMIK